METAVTLVTANAESADKLGEADYMDIFREIREKMSLRKFVEVIGSQYSIAWWGKYENGGVTLTRTGKGELRRAVGLAALPLTVTEVTGEVDPDATVWQVGGLTGGEAGAEGAALGQYAYDRVVLVGRELHEPVLLRLNGNLQVVAEAGDLGEEGAVTQVTGARRARTYKGLSVRRETWERLNSARLRAGLSWDEFLGQVGGEQT